jgi:hypothetical protein
MSSKFSVSLAACGIALFLAIPGALGTTTNIGDPSNVLSGTTTVSSSTVAPAFPSSHSVDDLVRFCCAADQDHGLIFSNSDQDQRVGFTGDLGAIDEIRIWTIFVPVDGRIPNSVTVRSSLNTLAGAALINPVNFETALGIFPLGAGAFTGLAANTDTRYATINVDAPAGTQSLFLAFGGVTDGKGERISEVQAFVPEPSTLLLAVASLFAMSGFRRGRRG